MLFVKCSSKVYYTGSLHIYSVDFISFLVTVDISIAVTPTLGAELLKLGIMFPTKLSLDAVDMFTSIFGLP